MEGLQKKVIVQLKAGDEPAEIVRRFEVHRNTVYSIKKLYKATGGYSKHQSSGRPLTVQMVALISDIRQKINANPVCSICNLRKEHNVSCMFVQRVVTKYLKLKSRAVQQSQLLTAEKCQKCVKLLQEMLNFLKSNPQKNIVFSSEKN